MFAAGLRGEIFGNAGAVVTGEVETGGDNGIPHLGKTLTSSCKYFKD